MRKPKIKIEPTGLVQQPFWFCVKWPGRGYLNKPYRTLQDAFRAVERQHAAKESSR